MLKWKSKDLHSRWCRNTDAIVRSHVSLTCSKIFRPSIKTNGGISMWALGFGRSNIQEKAHKLEVRPHSTLGSYLVKKVRRWSAHVCGRVIIAKTSLDYGMIPVLKKIQNINIELGKVWYHLRSVTPLLCSNIKWTSPYEGSLLFISKITEVHKAKFHKYVSYW